MSIIGLNNNTCTTISRKKSNPLTTLKKYFCVMKIISAKLALLTNISNPNVLFPFENNVFDRCSLYSVASFGHKFMEYEISTRNSG